MIEPAGHRVLIKPDDIQETDDVLRKAKELGIEIVKDRQTERAERASQVTGVIIGIGKTAWLAYDKGEPWAVVGDRVTYSKYGGTFVSDPDTGEEFILLNDEDITCILKEGSKDE